MAADLSGVLAGKGASILCPICLSEFGETDVETRLSEEHVIPASADGTLTTLTCKSCNSTAGHTIDKHFARFFKIENARQTGKEFDAKVKIKGSVGAPAHVSFTPQGLHFRLEPTTQYVRDELAKRFLQYHSGEREINLSISNNIDPLKLVASITKMAYLSLFSQWGYKYALLPNRDWVRTGIRFERPEREWLEQLIVPATITDIGELSKTPTRMSFEANCNGINVACSVLNGVLGPGALWVILPPMSDMNTSHYRGLQRAAESIRGKSLTVTFLNPDRPATISATS
jgi:hypothetical protein